VRALIRPRFRRTVAALLIAASAITPLAIGAVWLRAVLLDESRYVATVAPLASNQAIVSTVADEVTTTLLAQVDEAALESELGPLAPVAHAGIHGYVSALVEKALLTDQFAQLWEISTRQSHKALVAALEGKPNRLIAPDGSVDVNLTDVVAAARDALAATGLHAFAKVQPGLVQERFTIARPGSVHRARHAVSQLKTLSILLPAAAIVLFGLAFMFSRERRRTLLRAGVGLAAAGAVGLVLVAIGRWYYLHSVAGPDLPHPAATALYDTVLRDLRLAYKATSLVGLGLVGAALLAGPSRLATRLRSVTVQGAGEVADRAVGESVTHSWVAANKSILRTVAVVAGLLLLLSSPHPSLRLLVELGAGVGLVLLLLEILARPRSS
jgi:hypothetical protein